MVTFSLILAIGTLIASTFATPLHFSGLDRRSLPVGISVSTARTYLSQLTVATPSNSPPIQEGLLPHLDHNGKCDTRESQFLIQSYPGILGRPTDRVVTALTAAVLKRDGTNVVTDANCSPVSGHWVSPYDGVPTNLASDLDIDHVVPLKEAWISGARDWTADRREQFANDLAQPQLIAVTDNLNQAKGDKDPSTWFPPLNSFKCTYVLAWIQVKYYYGLTVDSAEKTALTNTLNAYC